MKRKIDFMTILGFILAVALMFIGMVLVKNTPPSAPVEETTDPANKPEYEIIMSNLVSFFDPTSIAIVLGGTFSVLMIMFPASQFAKIPKHLKIIFMPKQYEPSKYIEKIVECAKKARVSGNLALEEDIGQMQDAFLKNSIQMVVDAVDPEKVKSQMEEWMDNADARHTQERALYDKGAALGPAFGMIGTLIGLINMLKSLTDVASVGPNMAVALITTFYGSLLANVVFAPISNKLRVRHEEEYLCMSIICEGVQAIQVGDNPKLIQEKLVHMLPEYKQKKLVDLGAEGAGGTEKGKKEKKPKKSKEAAA